jgi:hypothetical protein
MTKEIVMTILFLSIECDKKSNILSLTVSGDRFGTINGKSIREVCEVLISYLDMKTTIEAFVDCRGYGTMVADYLKNYIDIVKLEPKPLLWMSF